MGFCVPASSIVQNIPGLQYFRLLGPLELFLNRKEPNSTVQHRLLFDMIPGEFPADNTA